MARTTSPSPEEIPPKERAAWGGTDKVSEGERIAKEFEQAGPQSKDADAAARANSLLDKSSETFIRSLGEAVSSCDHDRSW